MHRHHPPLLVGVKLGRIVAVRAGDAAAYVPLFFRLATLACRTSLANFCPASRNSKSMAPNSSASDTSTARSTIWRTVASIFGRSSFMRASMRCSRVSSAAAGRERADMVSSLVNIQGGFPAPAQATTRHAEIPPKYQLHTLFRPRNLTCLDGDRPQRTTNQGSVSKHL